VKALAVTLLLAIAGACSPPSQPPAADTKVAATPDAERGPPPAVKVAISRDGALTVDGAPSDAVSLDAKLAAAADAGGSVFYYREDPNQEASPAVEETFKGLLAAMTKYRLPICLSETPDYARCYAAEAKRRGA
jgi:hypothetical protein